MGKTLLIDEALIGRIKDKDIRKPPALPGTKFEHKVVVKFDSIGGGRQENLCG